MARAKEAEGAGLVWGTLFRRRKPPVAVVVPPTKSTIMELAVVEVIEELMFVPAAMVPFVVTDKILGRIGVKGNNDLAAGGHAADGHVVGLGPSGDGRRQAVARKGVARAVRHTCYVQCDRHGNTFGRTGELYCVLRPADGGKGSFCGVTQLFYRSYRLRRPRRRVDEQLNKIPNKNIFSEKTIKFNIFITIYYI